MLQHYEQPRLHARVPIPYSGLWVGVDDDGPLHHIGKGEEVEVRVGFDVVFTACLLPLGECLHGGKHQGNGSIEGGTRGMAAWREAPGEWQHRGRH